VNTGLIDWIFLGYEDQPEGPSLAIIRTKLLLAIAEKDPHFFAESVRALALSFERGSMEHDTIYQFSRETIYETARWRGKKHRYCNQPS